MSLESRCAIRFHQTHKILVVLTVLCNSNPQTIPAASDNCYGIKEEFKERGWIQSRMAKTMLILRGVPLTDGFRTGPALWQSTHTNTLEKDLALWHVKM